MSDLRVLNNFVGIAIRITSKWMSMSQQQYASFILERANIPSYKPSRTPVDTHAKLVLFGTPVLDPTLYQSGRCSTVPYFLVTISYIYSSVVLSLHA